ncbi:MAE_28990/MAE_18760 family HEPN-like nuclease [Polaromonas sp. P5_D5]
MITTKAEFQRRYQEIEEYLTYVEGLEKVTGLSVTLMATMKASALLMLYNLVESTMTNLVQAVFDHLRQKSIGLSSMSDVMKIMVLGNIRKRNPANLVEKMRKETLDIAIASFDKASAFSGNVDTQKIRETFKEFGVTSSAAFKEPVLLEIKTARNDLAHGSKSFADAGKTYSAKDLREKQIKVGKILEKTIAAFEKYINSKAYA